MQRRALRTHTTHTAKPSRASGTATNRWGVPHSTRTVLATACCTTLHHVVPCCTTLQRAAPTCGVPHAHGLVDRRRDHPARAVELEVPDRARVALERLHGGTALLRPPLRRTGAWKPRVVCCMPRVRRVLYAVRRVSTALDPSAQHHRARVIAMFARVRARVRVECAWIQWIGYNAAALPIAHLDRAVA